MPEKLVKGLHEGIVSESQYYRVQEMLGLNKRKMQSKPKDEFPLKGILKSPCCDTYMTAGWSKGKKNYYLYYRCVSHSNVNISGQKLHDAFDELLKHLSFTQDYVNQLISRVTGFAKSTSQISDQRKKVLNSQLNAIDIKIENLESKLFEGTIIDHTFKRWMIKYEGEKAKLREQFDLSQRLESDLHDELQLLPYLLNMPKVFQDSSLGQKHAIFNEVFKQKLTYREGSFRTPSINPEYVHKLLILKEKGLLFLEQPSGVFEGLPSCGEWGIRTRGPFDKSTVFKTAAIDHSANSPRQK
jgi:site-specific DNA recombinase